jgi:hypothetical protein
VLCRSTDAPDRATGASGLGELLANTLAVKNVSVVVLDVKPIQTDNCMCPHIWSAHEPDVV